MLAGNGATLGVAFICPYPCGGQTETGDKDSCADLPDTLVERREKRNKATQPSHCRRNPASATSNSEGFLSPAHEADASEHIAPS